MHRKLCESRILATEVCVRSFGITGTFFCMRLQTKSLQPCAGRSGSCRNLWELSNPRVLLLFGNLSPWLVGQAKERLLLVRRYFIFAAQVTWGVFCEGQCREEQDVCSPHSPDFPPLPAGGGLLDEGQLQDSEPDAREKSDSFVTSSHSIHKCPSPWWLLEVPRCPCRHGI